MTIHVQKADMQHALTRKERLIAFGLLAALFIVGVFDHNLWSNDAREGAMIREMVREGQWVTPVFSGQAYLEKPPLLHWTAALMCRAAGTVTAGLVRLPSALYGFGAVVLAIALGRRFGRERAGWLSALLCATSMLYIEYSRVVLTDAALTFMVMLALYTFWRAYSAVSHRLAFYFIFLVVSALSFYAKGLIGPGFIWVTVGVFLAMRRRWQLLFGLASAFAIVFALALAPWVYALWQKGGLDYLETAFWANQFGRFFSFNDPALPEDPYRVHKQPVWFYLVKVLPVRLLPWTVLALPAFAHWFRPGSPVKGELPALLKTALIAMLVVLHASSAKAACYVLPLFPIIFLMVAVWLEDALDRGPALFERMAIAVTYGALVAALLILPLAYAMALGKASPFLLEPGLWVASRALVLEMLALGLTLLIGGQLWRAWQNRQAARAGMRFPVMVAFLLLFHALALIPIYDFQRTSKPFADVVAREIASGRSIGFAGKVSRDRGEFMFHLDRRLDAVSVTNDQIRAFLFDTKGPAGVILPVRNLAPAVTRLPTGCFRVLRANHAGDKSADFLLLINDR